MNDREIKNLIRTSLAFTYNTGGLTEEALMIVYRLSLKRPMREVGILNKSFAVLVPFASGFAWVDVRSRPYLAY